MPVQGNSARVAGKLRRLLLLCGAVALALPGIASAATVQYSLADLLPVSAGGTGQNANGFVVGDKLYNNFQFSSPGGPGSPNSPRPLTPQDVNVRLSTSDRLASVPGDDRYTLTFTFGLDAFPGERHDLVLCYDVNVLPNSPYFINHLGLRYNGTVPAQGVGGAATSVTETAYYLDQNGNEVGDPILLTVFNDGAGRLPDDNSDFVAINPTRSMRFCKDIIVSSQDNGGYAVISVVDNIVDQIPEPSMLGLVAFAGGGLLLRRRRA